MTTTDPEKTSINKSMVSLKLIMFLFYGALLCLWPHLPLHMMHLKFNMEEIKYITTISSIISVLGPLIFGLVLDRIAVKNSAVYGKYVKIFLFLTLTLAGIFYGLLLVVVGPVERSIADLQPVTFGCDSSSGIIYQKKCEHQADCLSLANTRGKIQLTSCSYTCQKPLNFENLYEPSVLKLTNPSKVPLLDAYKKDSSAEFEYDENYDNSFLSGENNIDDSKEIYEDADQFKRRKRNIKRVYVEPPHICLGDGNKEAKLIDRYTCHAYSIDSKMINLTVESSGLNNNVNDSNAGFCQHKLENFKCNIPEPQKLWMRFYMNSSHCKPMIECEIFNPYDSADNFLSGSRCYKSIGNESEILVLYLIIRSLADLFTITAHTILNVALIVATRETSIGRGNIGHQLAWGAIGTLMLAVIIGLTNHFTNHLDQYLIPMITGPALILFAAIVALLANNFQKLLSPSEWWWHTKYGIVAIPMAVIRNQYKILAVFIVILSLILGSFWNIVEIYRQINYTNIFDIVEWNLLADITHSKTFSYALGALFSIPVLWNAEKLVQKLGHSNIFIISLATYIIRFSGIMSLKNPSVLFLELLEPINFALTWITLIFYLRHVVSKTFLATSQAILVMFWFGFGRAIGWLLMYSQKEHLFCILSSLACLFAVLYFIVYHCILLPFYHIPSQALNDKSFAHERVFHDERSRKGFFKY